MWVSTDCDFANNSSKTDNFQVRTQPRRPLRQRLPQHPAQHLPQLPQQPLRLLLVLRVGCASPCFTMRTPMAFRTMENRRLPGGSSVSLGMTTCTCGNKRRSALMSLRRTTRVLERHPNELNWIHNTSTEVEFDVDTGYTENVTFGNVCVGAGGGFTLAYWSNRNGRATRNTQ